MWWPNFMVNILKDNFNFEGCFMKRSLLLLSILCQLGYCADVENTLDKKFYQISKNIEGKVFEGVDDNGEACFGVVKEMIKGTTYENTPYWAPYIPRHKVMRVIVSSSELSSDIYEEEEDKEYKKLMESHYGHYPYEFIYKVADAGWCSNCGSSKSDGRFKESFSNKYLGFYHKGHTPSHDISRIFLNEDGSGVSSFEFYEYSDIYIPVINYARRLRSYKCYIK